MTAPAMADTRDAVFVSYSHDDQEWRRKFVVMLAPVVRNQGLIVWDDTHIPVGDDWRRDIDDGVRRATVALLLITDSYLASRFSMEIELPSLVAHGVRLMPVLVEDCLWDQEPLLASVQWAHDPNREGPLEAADPREVNGRIVRVCRKLLEIVPLAVHLPRPAAPVQAEALSDWMMALPQGATGSLHGVPALPVDYLERSELSSLRKALLRAGSGAVGLTGDVQALGLYGQGGIGKTVLATAAAHDQVVRTHFPDGLFWITVGEQPDLIGLQTGLLSRLGVAGIAPRSASEGLGLLQQALADRQVLLVIDDVWSVTAAAAFRVTAPRSRVLYTTRDPEVLEAVHAIAERVEVLSPIVARQLLARIADTPVNALPAKEVDRVLAATGRVTLAVALVAAAVRGGASWLEVADELDRGGETFLDHPYANAFKALQVATAALDPDLAFAYTSLAVYPPDIRIPVAAVSRYWGQLRGSSPSQVQADLQMLADRELVILDRGEVAFHDLQHSYLLLQVNKLVLLHADLLAGYQALLPSAGAGWWQLPVNEPYIWDHLLHHLRGAGDRARVASTLTDLAYLAKRIALAGPYAAEADLDEASAVCPDDPRIGWLRRWLAQHPHLFVGLTEPADVAVTLAGWLADLPAGTDRHRLDPLLPSLFLAPKWGLPAGASALHRVLPGHTGPVNAVAFSLDGMQLASAGNDGTVRLSDPRRGRALVTLTGHTGPVNAVAFSPDGRRLASTGNDGTVRLWDRIWGTALVILPGHAGSVYGMAFSPDGRRLASADDDGTVRLWDPMQGTALVTLASHIDSVYAVAFSPDGTRLASACADGMVRLWDPATDSGQTADLDEIGPVHAVAFSPDGTRLVSASADGRVRLWDPAQGRVSGWLTGHAAPVYAVAFSRDGARLASACADGTVRVRHRNSYFRETQVTLTSHAAPVYAVAFSPDGTRLVSADNGGTVRWWDLTTGAELVTLKRSAGLVRAAALSPNGRRLAYASMDGTIHLSDPLRGTTLGKLTGHTGPVNAVAFTMDGECLASAGSDGAVRLWDSMRAKRLVSLTGHTGPVKAVAFSPDGRRLASVGDDGTVRLWDGTTARMLSLLRLDAPIQAVTWGQGAIALGKKTSVVLLAVVTHE